MQSNLTASDPLPARGSDTAEILINDHQIIKALLNDLTQAPNPQQRTSVLERLKAALTIHNAMEENLIYPALALVAGKKTESAHLFEETAQADTLVFELDTMLKTGADSDFTAKAKKLQGAILEHIDDEEQSALPHLQKHADASQAEMLTKAVREFRASISIRTK